MASTALSKTHSPVEVGRHYGVTSCKVRGWIRSGVLRAVNVGDKRRPRWRISAEDLAEFEASRTPVARTPRPPRRRGRPAVKEFL